MTKENRLSFKSGEVKAAKKAIKNLHMINKMM